MIVTTKQIALKAQKGKYAVPAFNVSNLEMAQAVLRAAAKLKSPVIVQTSEGAVEYAGHPTIVDIIRKTAQLEAKNIPVAIHLDHGKHLPVVKASVDTGYSSVHMDGSEKPYSTNVKLTKEAVKYAHKHKVSVQGELGALLGREGLTKIKKGFNYESMMTDPVKAKDFVKQTGVDTLAVNVGTIHGSFKGIEKISIPRLKEIQKNVRVPLVLHGGSGNKASEIKQAIKHGICIINVDTDLRIAWAKALKNSAAKINLSKKIDPRETLKPATLAMQKEAEKTIKLFGSNSKA